MIYSVLNITGFIFEPCPKNGKTIKYYKYG